MEEELTLIMVKIREMVKIQVKEIPHLIILIMNLRNN